MAETTRDGDVEFIRSLAELLRETELTEIEVKREYGESDRMKVRVSRHVQMVQAAPPPPQTPQPPTAQPAPAPPGEAPSPGGDDPAHHPGAVTSPMVGTAYLQAEPGSDPFVRVGDSVSEGQTVVIVEAMKTMNHIPAPRSGTVRRILIEDGAPVEFGAPLMIIE
jgi:acetyl-CoA carboxylase biotin carboxyl carrier protein